LARLAGNVEVRKAAVSKLTEQNTLTAIAQNDTSAEVRETAVKKLEDQSVLAEIAKTDSQSDVRFEAVMKITDQAILTDLAKTAEDSSVRYAAVSDLEDQQTLAEMALNDSSENVRNQAFSRIQDQAALAEILKTEKDDEILSKILRRLISPDQDFLLKLSEEPLGYETRIALAEKLTDQTILARIALSSDSVYERTAAVTNLMDQSVLSKIVQTDAFMMVRSAAIKNLTISAVLDHVARTDSEELVRQDALRKLGLAGIRQINLSGRNYKKLVSQLTGLPVKNNLPAGEPSTLRMKISMESQATSANYSEDYVYSESFGSKRYSGAQATASILLEDYNVTIRETGNIPTPHRISQWAYMYPGDAPIYEAENRALAFALINIISDLFNEKSRGLLGNIARNNSDEEVRLYAEKKL